MRGGTLLAMLYVDTDKEVSDECSQLFGSEINPKLYNANVIYKI